MTLQKPRVEFVPIDLSINASSTSTGTGGGQYCKASQPDAQYCPNWEGDIDWDAPMPG